MKSKKTRLKGTISIGIEGIVSSGINNLLWVSYRIILSLYTSAFGSYSPNLFKLTSKLRNQPFGLLIIPL